MGMQYSTVPTHVQIDGSWRESRSSNASVARTLPSRRSHGHLPRLESVVALHPIPSPAIILAAYAIGLSLVLILPYHCSLLYMNRCFPLPMLSLSFSINSALPSLLTITFAHALFFKNPIHWVVSHSACSISELSWSLRPRSHSFLALAPLPSNAMKNQRRHHVSASPLSFMLDALVIQALLELYYMILV